MHKSRIDRVLLREQAAMKVSLRNNQDFLGGLLLVAVGVLAFYIALGYTYGTAVRMGPGYFPRAVAGILIAFGAYILVRGLRNPEEVSGRWGWKPLFFITVALIAFAFAMDRFGLIPALVLMFFIAAFGGHEFKIIEVLILTVFMSLFSVGVFVYGLGLPYTLIQGF